MTNSLIVITGGSFQGKSLLSIRVATKLNYSAVICTDLIRNVLRVQNPAEKCFSTSSYILTKSEWMFQKEQTCLVLTQLLEIYRERGEKIILEGVHFTKAFLELIMKRGGIVFCIDNKLPFITRIEKKTVTRTKLNGFDSKNANWIKESSYVLHEQRIEEIHIETLMMCRELNAHIISFRNLSQAYKKILSIINV